MGKIFYIMGKSSSGKDTIYENLLGREGLSLHPLTSSRNRLMHTAIIRFINIAPIMSL